MGNAGKFNRGFKGVDHRDGQQAESKLRRGRHSVTNHSLNRKKGRNLIFPEYVPTHITDWRRCGWSQSLHPISGAIMHHSPSTTFGAGWGDRSAVSVPAIRLRDMKPDKTASYTFKAGNCINGNANGSWYGFAGLMPRMLTLGIKRNGNVQTVNPTIFGDLPQFGWSAYSTDNRLGVYENGSARKNIDNVTPGDAFKVQVTSDGVITYWSNKAATVTDATWSLQYTSTINMIEYAEVCTDPHFVACMQSAQEGADGNHANYDHKFEGEVLATPNFFDLQLEQEMTPLPSSSATVPTANSFASKAWVSSDPAKSPKAVLELNGESGMKFNASSNYTTWTHTNYFITASGIGGIYTAEWPTVPSWMPHDAIMGLHDFNETSFNYNDVLISMRGGAVSWNYHTGVSSKVNNWYNAGTDGALSSGNAPLTTGSKMAIILTGSKFNWCSLYTGSYMTPANDPDNGSMAFFLIKMVDPNGSPLIQDYVSDHWFVHNVGMVPSVGDGNTVPAQKLGFGNGLTGDRFSNVRIGEQFFLSGSGHNGL